MIEALYENHFKEAHRVALKLVTCPEDAADVVHEVFVRALSAIHRIHCESERKAWILGVTRYVALDTLRRRRHREMAPELEDEEPSCPGEAISARNFIVHLSGQLTYRQRLIAKLHLVHGDSQGEVAAHLGLTRKTVNREIRQVRFVADLLAKVA